MDQALVEQVVEEFVLEWAQGGQPRSKDGRFAGKGRAELKHAHASFLMKDLQKRAEGIKNGNVKRSALARLKGLAAHQDVMLQAIYHPEVGDDGNPQYAPVHRAHSELAKGARAFRSEFKPDLAGGENQ